MKNLIHNRSRTKQILALLLTGVLLMGSSGCNKKASNKSDEIKPVTVQREPEPQALQTANEAAAIALRQYVCARLATEAFLTMDASSITREELSEMVDELYVIWENAKGLSLAAEALSGQALAVLEAPVAEMTAAAKAPQTRFMTLAAGPGDYQIVALASNPQKLDPQTWAENLTKQYDAIKGAQRYQQLARQLGTDAKAAYEQMTLAQEIINGQAMEDAAFWDKMTKIAQTTKTASKVGVFVVGTIVTGGGSLTALGASGWSLAQAGGVIVGGADCIVDIAATGSNIILGENHQVTVGFEDVKDQLAPVSAVVGLASFNAGETGEQLAYIGDTLTDWFFEGKVMGVQVDNRSVTARIFDSAGTTALKSALESAGYVFPETSKTLVQIMDELESDPEAALTRMADLGTQMAELMQAAGIPAVVSPEPGGSENTPPSESSEWSIFGRYTCVATGGVNNETITSTVEIRDQGNGSLLWADDDAEMTLLTYDPATNIIHTESGGLTLHIEFSLSGNTVIGSGYMSGTFWDEPVDETFELTKISD